MFRAIGRIVSSHPVWFLALWPVLGVTLIVLSPKLEEETSEGVSARLPVKYESYRVNEMLAREFQGYELDSSSLVVLMTRRGGLRPEDDREIKRIVEWLRKQTYRKVPEPVAHADILNKIEHGYLENRLVSADKATTIIAARLKTIFISDDTRQLVSDLMDFLDLEARQHPGLTFSITGSAAVGHDYSEAIASSLGRTELVTYLLVIVILILIYRSPVAALVPLVTILLSLKVAEAMVAQFAVHMTQIPTLVPMFMVVVMFGAGTNYCLFLVGRYKEELGRGLGYQDAARIAITHVGQAVGASAGTEVLGLCLMVFASFEIFSRTGVCVGLSLIPALLAALTLVPAIFLVLKGKAFWPGRADAPLTGTTATRIWRWVATKVCRRPGTVLLVATVVMTPLAVVGVLMEPNYDVFAELPGDSVSVGGNRLLLEKFGPQSRPEQMTAIVSASIDMRTREGLKAILEIVRDLKSTNPHVKEVRSLVTPLGAEIPLLTDYALESGPSGEGTTTETGPAPETGTESRPWWRRAVELPRKQALEAVLKEAAPRYVSRDMKSTKIDIVLDENAFSTAAMRMVKPMRTHLEQSATKTGVKDIKVLLGGLSAYMDDLRIVTRTDLTRLMILVSLMVYLFLLWMMRDWFSPIYMLGTMVVSYLVTMGVSEILFRHVLGGAGLDWKVQFFLFVLLVAIGEDYNIYLMARVREETARRGMREGVRRAIIFTGSIISACGLIMAGTFAALMTARVAVMVQIGFAMAFGITLDTFIIRPVVLPAITLVAKKLHLWHQQVPEGELSETTEELIKARNTESTRPPEESAGGPR